MRPAQIHPEHHGEDNRIHDNTGHVLKGGDATIHDRTGLYIAILALVLAGMGLGYEIAQSGMRAEIRQLQEQSIDARIRAGVAPAEAQANEAKVNARVALKEVETLCASLKASGIKSVECH